MNENDLRDVAALFAMLGLMMQDTFGGKAGIAEEAFKQADAFIKARNPEVEEGIVAVKPKRKTK
jgi:hypothetical protein